MVEQYSSLKLKKKLHTKVVKARGLYENRTGQRTSLEGIIEIAIDGLLEKLNQ